MFDKNRSRHQVIKVNCFFLEANISIRLIRIFQKCQSFSCFYRNIFHFVISTWYTWFLHLDVIDGLSIHLITYVWSWHAKNVSIISTGLNLRKHYGKVQLYFDIIWHIVSHLCQKYDMKDASRIEGSNWFTINELSNYHWGVINMDKSIWCESFEKNLNIFFCFMKF